jgi:hypothetical protein
MTWIVGAAGAVLLCLSFLSDAAAIDLRASANKISFSEKARAYGLNSGNLIVVDGRSAVAYDKRFRPGPFLSMNSDQQLTVADNGMYYGLISPYKAGVFQKELLHRIDIHDARHNVIWSFEGLAHGSYYISPSGDYMIFAGGTVGAFDWQVIVCNSDQTATLLDIDALKEIRFASDGSRFVIDGGPRGVYLYDKSGRRLKEFEPQNSFAISATGEYFAVVKARILSIYRDTSLLSGNIAVDGEVIAIKISEKSNRLYYISAFNLVVVDMGKGTRIWGYKPETAQYRFTSLDLSVDHQYIACGVILNLGASVPKDKRHPKGYIYMFDIGRNFIRKAEFPNTAWATGQPEVGFWPDQRTILVRTHDRILTFEMI